LFADFCFRQAKPTTPDNPESLTQATAWGFLTFSGHRHSIDSLDTNIPPSSKRGKTPKNKGDHPL